MQTASVICDHPVELKISYRKAAPIYAMPGTDNHQYWLRCLECTQDFRISSEEYQQYKRPTPEVLALLRDRSYGDANR